MINLVAKKTFQETYLTKHNLVLFISGASLLFLFFAFTFWVRADSLRSFDFDTTVRLQNITPLRLDPFFSFLSVVGRFEFTTPALAIVLLLWSKLKPKRLLSVVIILGLFCTAHVIEVIGKTILEQPGPPHMFLRSQFSEFPGLHVYTNASYPSGHSLRIVFLGVIYFYITLKSRLPMLLKAGVFLFLAGTTFAMLYSRISLGEHWTTDVVGGSILGLSIALLSLILLV